MTNALIIGASGQDGSYLAEHLIDLGYDNVYGLIRGAHESHPRYEWLSETIPRLQLIGGDLLDAGSLREAIWETEPDEIYNLGAVSSPGQAWQQPMLTAEVTGLGVLRLLEIVHSFDWGTRVVQAGSLATHGPYGAAKTYARAICADYRQRGLNVSVAVLGGHHSPRRAPCYFSRKVTKAVAAIAAGAAIKLKVGSLERMQDWGWASEFVRFLPRLAELEPDDYVISTGWPHSCLEWVEAAFKVVDLDWYDHVISDVRQGNVTDVPMISAQPDERLGWIPLDDFQHLVATMVMADVDALAGDG